MGKRKSRKKRDPPKSTIEPLDTQFTCPFCNHPRACDVVIDRSNKTGSIRCRMCNENYHTMINYLSQEIDVYSDWIDECEKVNS